MQVSVETTNGLQRKMTVQVPNEEIEQEVSTRLNSLKSKVSLKGFRKGKVPLAVIKEHYDGSVRQEVLEALVQRTWQEAVVQEKLRPAGAPQIDPKASEAGEQFEYCATFEVYPEISLADIDGEKIEKPVCEVADSDIDTVLEKIQVQRVTWNEVDREAKEEDRVTINFLGKIDDVAFEGGAAENHPLVLGSETMIPGFEEQLIGIKGGETRDIEVTFPENYSKAELGGKTAIFEITAQSVAEPVLPEINEEFVKSFGVESGSVDQLRTDIKGNMEAELDQKLRDVVKNLVLDILVAKNDFDLPTALIDKEILALREQYRKSMPNMKDSDMPADLLEEEARKRVKLGLLISEVIQQDGIEAKEDRVSGILTRLAAGYEEPEKLVQQYRADANAMRSIEALAMEEEVVEHLLGKLSVTEKTKSFDEVMNP